MGFTALWGDSMANFCSILSRFHDLTPSERPEERRSRKTVEIESKTVEIESKNSRKIVEKAPNRESVSLWSMPKGPRWTTANARFHAGLRAACGLLGPQAKGSQKPEKPIYINRVAATGRVRNV